MEQHEYWESVSDTKNFTTPLQTEEFQKYIDQQDIVLDVGCGYGRALNLLYQNGYHNLIGMDFSEGMIGRGRSTYPYLDLRVMKPGNIALADSSVDAVILFAVLTCIVSNEEQKALIREIRRVLKPGGILYVNDFLLNQDERNLARYAQYKEKYGVYGAFELPEGAVLRHQDEQWLNELFHDFSQPEYEHLTFTTMIGHTSNGFYYIGKKD